jgi:sulfur-carrier protein
MIRVVLPPHLRTLAHAGKEIEVPVEGPVTIQAILDAVEASYPMLRGTIRDPGTQQRRPLLRFFACGQDWSLERLDAALPELVARGQEPLFVIGAIAGG